MWGQLAWVCGLALAAIVAYIWAGGPVSPWEGGFRGWLGEHVNLWFYGLLFSFLFCLLFWSVGLDNAAKAACVERGGEVIDGYRDWWCAAPGTTR